MTEAQLQPKEEREAVLARTPEQVESDKRTQEEARERLAGLVTDSPAVAQYRWAVGAESPMRGNEESAEINFWQGRFGPAAAITSDSLKRSEYQRFASAMFAFNAPLCDCRPIQMPGKTAKGTSVPSRREIQRVFVGQISQEVKFIFCERCKKTFAQSV